jgi:hypothetical protein
MGVKRDDLFRELPLLPGEGWGGSEELLSFCSIPS